MQIYRQSDSEEEEGVSRNLLDENTDAPLRFEICKLTMSYASP